jgi:hypothetical protein
MSQRQPSGTAALERNPDWIAAPGPRSRPGESTAIFDVEYAIFRARLLSLARDGHRLIGRIAKDRPNVNSRAVRGFLKRIDRMDQQAAHRGLEPLRKWVRSLKSRVLDSTLASS